MRKLNGLMLALAFAAVMVIGLGCEDPDRKACKDACEKIFQCDQMEGGTGQLPDNWQVSCEAACEEADEINEQAADCINALPLDAESCTKISQECGANQST